MVSFQSSAGVTATTPFAGGWQSYRMRLIEQLEKALPQKPHK
jgi:hypothetical protein